MILQLILIKVMQQKTEKKNKKYLKASLSIEAALSMSIFIIAISSLLGPFIILKNNANILNQLNNTVSKNISYTKAIENAISNRNDKESVLTDLSKLYDVTILSSNTIFSIYTSANDSIECCIPLNNNVFDDESKLIEYNIEVIHKVPFSNILGVHVGQELVSSKRAFVGASPARWNNSNDYIDNSDIVYISNNASVSGVYHLDEYCTYLRHKLNIVSEKEAKKQCTICSYCKLKYKHLKNKDAVYVTTYGDNYHYTDTCPMIYAYIKKVLKSSVPQMHSCSKCNKENN